MGAVAALAALGVWYAADRGVPPDLIPFLLPAVLLEICLYVAGGLRVVRERAEELPPGVLATVLTLLAPLSWAAYAIPFGYFSALAFASLLGLGLTASFWYLVFGRKPMADGGFLLLLAIPMLLEVFKYLYPSPVERLPMHVLGAMMWYRTGLVVILAIRRMGGIGFGFWPTRLDWAIGVRNYLWFLPLGLGATFALRFADWKPLQAEWRTALIAAATFFGVLWVLAVAEEFFFRGVLQQHLGRILGSDTAGLCAASLVFGAVHLPYREFPNWPFALLAAMAGVFYGRAYLQARSIRAAMVTHALVVTTWKTFLT
jgi:uncharacterized protein